MRAFAVLAYVTFLASFLYFAGFVTGILPARAPAALLDEGTLREIQVQAESEQGED